MNVSMSEIKRFTTATDDLNVVQPSTGLLANHLNGPFDIMSEFHTDLRNLIQNSNDLDTFNRDLPALMERWGIPRNKWPSFPVRGGG